MDEQKRKICEFRDFLLLTFAIYPGFGISPCALITDFQG